MRGLQVTTLTGRFVELEPLRADHASAIEAAASGDRTTFGMTSVPDGADDVRAYVAVRLAEAAEDREAPFVQRRVGDGRIVGCTRYLDPHWTLGRDEPDEVEVGGTWLSADAQRTPINTEAKLLLLTHAFETWGVGRLAICTDARNTQSRTAIERIGAHLDGILPNHRAKAVAGEPPGLRDTAVYSIVADDWPRVRADLVAKLDR